MSQEQEKSVGQEKKPGKTVAAKKGVTKKVIEMRASETPAAAAVKTKSKTAAKTKPRAKVKPLQVSIEDIIRLRAYEIYLQRGATPGNPHEDWDVAEREVRAHFGQADAQ